MRVPLMLRWDGEAFTPLPYFRKVAADSFKSGETYRLVEVESRSWNSHKHFFACINQAWKNLREQEIDDFPSPDHLRKWALTFTEFCTVRQFDVKSSAELVRLVNNLRKTPDYVRIAVDISTKVVREFRPLSQSLPAMPNNRTFQRSKDQVLDVLARKLGVTVEELEDAARRAAA